MLIEEKFSMSILFDIGANMVKDFLKQASLFLKAEDIKCNEPMNRHTSFRVGGPAKIFITIHSEDALSNLLKLLKESKLPFFILGNGSNLLVSDKGYEGVIVQLGNEFAKVEITDNCVTAGAAAFLAKVSNCAMENSLCGLEFASGIPGTLGGGVVMNAGAYGGELSQVITRVRAMDREGNLQILEKDELCMGYRTSIFMQKPYIILQVTMELKKGDKEEILNKMNRYNRSRREKQPLEYPSAGSTFKRPEGYFAGKLIMDAGLAGFTVGGAKVSEKHCGFVINKNQATATDILDVMKEVEKRVKEKFGVELEPEVIFLGSEE